MKLYNLKSVRAKLILLTTVITSGTVFFESTAVTIAIPQIQADFNATIGELQWVINSYTLVLAVLILISGALSDRFGRKRLLLGGLFLFAVGSLLSGLATSIAFLVAARLVQGLGGAFIIPQSLAIINTLYTKDIRGHAIGIWGGASGAMAIFGPFVSGWIVDTFGWPYLFFLIIPISMVNFLMVVRYIPELKLLKGKSKIDLVGIGLLAIGLSSLSYSLIQISDTGWNNFLVQIMLVCGTAFMLLFILWERRVSSPLINLKIFAKRHIVIANLFTLMMYATIASVPFFLTMYLQQLRGLTATTAGLAMLPLAGAITVLTFFTGKLVDKYGAKWPMFVGAFVTGLGIVWMSRSGVDTSYLLVTVPGLLLIGVGFAIFIPALTKTALSVDEEYSGTASGVNNSVSRLAGLLGIALISAAALSIFTTSLQQRLEGENVPSKVVEDVTAQSGKLLQIDVHQDNEIVKGAIVDSFLESYRLQLFICAGMSFAGALLALQLRKEI